MIRLLLARLRELAVTAAMFAGLVALVLGDVYLYRLGHGG